MVSEFWLHQILKDAYFQPPTPDSLIHLGLGDLHFNTCSWSGNSVLQNTRLGSSYSSETPAWDVLSWKSKAQTKTAIICCCYLFQFALTSFLLTVTYLKLCWLIGFKTVNSSSKLYEKIFMRLKIELCLAYLLAAWCFLNHSLLGNKSIITESKSCSLYMFL